MFETSGVRRFIIPNMIFSCMKTQKMKNTHRRDTGVQRTKREDPETNDIFSLPQADYSSSMWGEVDKKKVQKKKSSAQRRMRR